MRVLAGGPAREVTSDLYKLHRESLEAQGCGGSVKAVEAGGLPSSVSSFEVVVRHEIVTDPGGPRWSVDKIERVAAARQVMLEACTFAGHQHRQALLMVDTDVILGPGVLERMWAVDAPVVFGCMWTRADWGQPDGWDAAPQVWDRHSYGFTPECWDALVAPGVNEVPVLGGGAVTLIRGRGFESHYWPLLKSLSAYRDMMCGEDRTYCLGLECRGIPMVAVTGLPIVHLHAREQQTPEMLERAREMLGYNIGRRRGGA